MVVKSVAEEVCWVALQVQQYVGHLARRLDFVESGKERVLLYVRAFVPSILTADQHLGVPVCGPPPLFVPFLELGSCQVWQRGTSVCVWLVPSHLSGLSSLAWTCKLAVTGNVASRSERKPARGIEPHLRHAIIHSRPSAPRHLWPAAQSLPTRPTRARR